MERIRPKKHLGQHWLKDENIARKIIGCLPKKTDSLVEIGPGLGVLTKYLAERDGKLCLVEYDQESVQGLRDTYDEKENLQIVHSDILKWLPSDHLSKPAWFIGNLPYNISSPIFFHLLDHMSLVAGGVFMVQKEVAERICAEHGNKQYGILSVLMGAYFELKYEFSVPPGVFFPKPKVDSGVFSIRPLADQPVDLFPKLKRIVKAGFGKRRKMLRNALEGIEFSEGAFTDELKTKRAEQLAVAEFLALANAVAGG